MTDTGKPSPPSDVSLHSLLESLPHTDPAVLKEMEDHRLINLHYAAIGMVASRWAFLEAIVDTWLSAFAGFPDPETSVCFTGQFLGIRPRLDAFIAIAKHQLGAKRSDSWTKQLENFATRATGLSEQRNRAVHDIWFFREASQPTRVEATARKKVRVIEIKHPTSDLLKLSEQIADLQREFDKMASAIFAQIHLSSHGKPSE